MQGVIVLNQYAEKITCTNPFYIIALSIWVLSCVFYWIVKDKSSYSELILFISMISAAIILCIPKEIGYKERRVFETYLDVRASISRIEEKYDIIEQRGKIYVLTEKE